MFRTAALVLVSLAIVLLACSSPKVTLYAVAGEDSRITTLTKVYIMTPRDMGPEFMSGDPAVDAVYSEMADQLAQQLRARGYQVVADRANATLLAELSYFQFTPVFGEYGLVEGYKGLWEGKVVSPIRWVQRAADKTELGMTVWKAGQYIEPLQRAAVILSALEDRQPLPPEVNPVWIGFIDASSRSLDLSRHIDEYVDILLSNFGETVNGRKYPIRPGGARK